MGKQRLLTKISFSDGNYTFKLSYHPDYLFLLYELYWNTGNGYSTNQALNAKGNEAFGKYGQSNIINYYIGNGRPNETGIVFAMRASDIIGMPMGRVFAYTGTQQSNLATFVQGDVFYEYERSVISSNSSFGKVGHSKLYADNALSWNCCPGVKTTTDVLMPEITANWTTQGTILAFPVDGFSCLGFWKDGKQIATGDSIDPGKADAIDYVAVFGKKCLVHYLANGGIGKMTSSTVYLGCSKYQPYSCSASAYTRSGYAYIGWNTRPDGTGVQYLDGAVLDDALVDEISDGSIKLYAQWRKDSFGISTSFSLPNDIPDQTPEISISPMSDSGLWREETSISVLAQEQGLIGIKFSAWNIEGITIGDSTANPLSFTMPDNDVKITAVYELRSLVVDHGIDEASEVAADGATSLTDSGGSAVDNLVYGTEVVFHAPNPKDGYYFSGWYNGNECVSTDQNYTVVLTGDVSLLARYSTDVVVSKNEEGGTGYISVDGVGYEGSENVLLRKELGASMQIAAVATSGAFGGWYDGEAILELFRDDTVVITGKFTYAARFIAEAVTVQVTCRSVKNSDTDDGALGTLVLAGAGVTDNGNGSYSVEGFTEVVLTAIQADGGLPLFRVMEEMGGVESAINISKPIRILSFDRTFIARWGSKGKFQVQVSSADNAAGMAYIGESAAVTSLTGEQDSTVTITALPSNGYRFVGWYEGDRLVSEKARYSFALVEPVSLQARFAEDVAAICVWEGSGENKRLSWKSKVFVMPRPFDPVAARVDATGYPVSLSVGTYSSPDAVPTRDHDVQVQNQAGRRLPRMRAERFLRISVESAHEVDSVVVATNLVEVN